MTRDKLFILKPGFADPAFPGQVFYCWHCVLMEGLIASFPAALGSVDVERIEWPRPRQAVIDLLGPDHQSLPVLVLADDAPAGLETGQHQGRRFVAGKDAILRALSVRCGIPDPHP
ncbi:DUF3088 domain-containing protein [Brevundimonas sp.]|uniref:DUF3088 domain-containing protein n=1 Tax=Brevundimonas sp. TaxID=1871086 RepID=UPI002D6CCF1D|nr:DUF3088 domain-containing protein [Brevundimonas sp.]HYC98864.1 DUF3088 domain-containing protein [Brevundimonas sp.]